jgi:hypothetical protein
MNKRSVWLVVFAVLATAGIADARITIRPRAESDAFFFHAQYSREPFDPASDFALEIYNCPSGAMPIHLAEREPLVLCDPAASGGPTLADLVYAVEVPGGSCEDHGRSCYFRDPTVDESNPGVSILRIQYSRRGHGNRVWLESFGDFSTATQANMLLLIKINGQPRAVLEDAFRPLGNGGWFSLF